LSFASTVNLYASASGTSNTTTPGKLAPSSPLYYDYTEDFEVDEYSRAPESLGSPPLFSIDKTIPEERPTSVDRSIPAESRTHQLSNSARLSLSPSPTPATPKQLESTQACKDARLTEGHLESCRSLLRGEYTSVQQDNRDMEKKIVRLSALGYGAQELSTHVEEAFGLLPARLFEVSVARIESEAVTSERPSGGALDICENWTAEMQPMASFPKGGDAHPPNSSSLPLARRPPRCEALAASDTEKNFNILSHDASTNDQLLGTFNPLASLTRSDEVEQAQGVTHTPTSSLSQNRVHGSSSCKPIDMGFSGLADLIKTLEQSSKGENSERDQPVFTASGKPPISASALSGGSIPYNKHINHAQTPFVSSCNQANARNNYPSSQVPLSKWAQPYGRSRKRETSTPTSYLAVKSPGFNNQMAIRTIPRSESPMLAPKPISPARQLKLKNSVPQLMKALPPLPPEPVVHPGSPIITFNSFDSEIPCHFSPLLPESSTATPEHKMGHGPDKATSCPVPPVSTKEEQADSATPTMPQPPPRLKLKMKSCTALRSLSPPSPKPRVGAGAYPSSTPSLGSPLAGVFHNANTKPPKFRLKITRASSSSFGTVRVNRDSGELKSAAGFHLRNHKDLFTSTAGIDHIFRQVGQHLHSRKASEASNTGSDSAPPLSSMLSPNAYVILNNTSPTTHSAVPGPRSTIPLSSHEAHSVFSDDGFQIKSHSSMRDIFSHLRARMAVPYVNRIGSQSYDDLTWNDRSSPQYTVPEGRRAASDLRSRSKSTESKPLRGFASMMHRHRLREKVKGWLKEARLVIKSRMKSRTTIAGQNEDRS